MLYCTYIWGQNFALNLTWLFTNDSDRFLHHPFRLKAEDACQVDSSDSQFTENKQTVLRNRIKKRTWKSSYFTKSLSLQSPQFQRLLSRPRVSRLGRADAWNPSTCGNKFPSKFLFRKVWFVLFVIHGCFCRIYAQKSLILHVDQGIWGPREGKLL